MRKGLYLTWFDDPHEVFQQYLSEIRAVRHLDERERQGIGDIYSLESGIGNGHSIRFTRILCFNRDVFFNGSGVTKSPLRHTITKLTTMTTPIKIQTNSRRYVIWSNEKRWLNTLSERGLDQALKNIHYKSTCIQDMSKTFERLKRLIRWQMHLPVWISRLMGSIELKAKCLDYVVSGRPSLRDIQSEHKRNLKTTRQQYSCYRLKRYYLKKVC